ncbi:MAG: lytic transglycosylase domain-containing protein [Candidatus Sericytochromatia bacterium]|nr:lytic transglycosylase domain-containing protein [Candidatus Sericytochromatia bacterium]
MASSASFVTAGSVVRFVGFSCAGMVLACVGGWAAGLRVFPYAHRGLIEREASRQGLDPLLVAAVIRIESGFDPRAVSSAGACGLMQLMPDTARWMAGKAGEPDPTGHLEDPAVNVRLGTAYLRYLHGPFRGDRRRVLAAYNAGAANVMRWSTLDEAFPETRTYVWRAEWAYRAYRVLYGGSDGWRRAWL